MCMIQARPLRLQTNPNSPPRSQYLRRKLRFWASQRQNESQGRVTRHLRFTLLGRRSSSNHARPHLSHQICISISATRCMSNHARCPKEPSDHSLSHANEKRPRCVHAWHGDASRHSLAKFRPVSGGRGPNGRSSVLPGEAVVSARSKPRAIGPSKSSTISRQRLSRLAMLLQAATVRGLIQGD